jgi:hypothetical protein
VGLIKKEFHILNVPYPRKDYFEITERRSAALAAVASGEPTPAQ